MLPIINKRKAIWYIFYVANIKYDGEEPFEVENARQTITKKGK